MQSNGDNTAKNKVKQHQEAGPLGNQRIIRAGECTYPHTCGRHTGDFVGTHVAHTYDFAVAVQ